MTDLGCLFSPEGQPIKASSQTRRYFKPGNQAALRMLFYWTHLQRSKAGKCEDHEDDIKKPHQCPQSSYIRFHI